MNRGQQALVDDVQQRHARGFVDPAAFRIYDAVFDLIAHAQAVAAADPIALEKQRHSTAEAFAVDTRRHALFEGDRHFLRRHCD